MFFLWRELKVMLAKCNQRSWHRLMSDAARVKLPDKQSSFKVIREHLMQFKPTKLAAV